MNLSVIHVGRGGETWRWGSRQIEQGHYLGTMPDPRTSAEMFVVQLFPALFNEVGLLVVGRPEATRCADWYGSVDDVRTGRCEVTRWQVLNLARVWLKPEFQACGHWCTAEHVPGYTDRRGIFRSTLASAVLRRAVEVVGYEYLASRPPCFLEEPYEVRWLLSYCDTRIHRGTIYAAAGWELYRTNERGIQTWRTRLPPLTADEDDEVRGLAETNPRSRRYRAQRAQLELAL